MLYSVCLSPVWQAAGGAFGILFKGGAGSAVDSIIPSLLAGLDGTKPDQALEGLRVILGVRPATLNTMLPKLLKPPLSTSAISAIGALAEVAGVLLRSSQADEGTAYT